MKPVIDRVEFGVDKRAIRIYKKVWKNKNKYSPATLSEHYVNQLTKT